MTVTADLVVAAGRISESLGRPRVGRVVLPAPERRADQHGAFCAVQFAGGSTGLAYVLLGDTRARLGSLDVDALEGREAAAVAEGLTQDDPAMRSVALAAVNALTRLLFDAAGFAPDFAANSLGSLGLAPGDRLGMIGFFPPLVRQARERGVPLTVLELREELVQEAAGLTVTLDAARLAGCNEIVSTSTVLLNDSLESVLEHARGCREFVLVGPSAGCVPDPLFARGVTGLGGPWVMDPERLLKRVASGDRWGDASRKYSLRNDRTWPGLDELLSRAADRQRGA